MTDEPQGLHDRITKLEGSDQRTGDYLRAITDLVMKIDKDRDEMRQREEEARKRHEDERTRSWQQTAVIAVTLLIGLLAIAFG